VTIPAYPIIREIKELSMQEGALNALMSGSGPTVFAVYEDEQCAQKAARKVKQAGLANEVFVTEFRRN
jgi:4-diphosphocytidyl-2-C-methyl-D-erythritol kinase